MIFFQISMRVFAIAILFSMSSSTYANDISSFKENISCFCSSRMLEKGERKQDSKKISTKNRKVLLLGPHLGVGGAQIAFLHFLKFLPKPISQYDICIAARGGELEDRLPKNFNYISIEEARLRTYATVVSFFEWIESDFWVPSIHTKRRIQWVHTDYKTFTYGSPFLRAENRKNIDLFVGVSQACVRGIIGIDGALNGKTVCIHNCIDYREILMKSKEEQNDIMPRENEKNLVTVARLDPVKGIDRAIKVHKKLHDEGYRFHWYFIGDGEIRKELEELVRSLKMEKYIHILGQKTNPFPYVKAADLFVLCSHSESFSLVVLEAKILRKPILCTRLEGVSEIICSGTNGLMVENSSEGLEKGIKAFIRNPQLSKKFQKALRHFRPNYSLFRKQLRSIFFDKKINRTLFQQSSANANH